MFVSDWQTESLKKKVLLQPNQINQKQKVLLIEQNLKNNEKKQQFWHGK